MPRPRFELFAAPHTFRTSRRAFALLRALLALTLLLLAACSQPTSTPSQAELELLDELENPDALIDRGGGLSVQAGPQAGPDAHRVGAWSAAAEWPLIGIHTVLLPDRRVLSYGTDGLGKQGAFVYDVWDPALGLSASAHRTLANRTGTDIFCGAQALLPTTGDLILAGGDLTINGKRNYSNDDLVLFDYRTEALTPSPLQLTRGRWYPTMTTLPNGELLLYGGRDAPGSPVLVPEVFNPATGWRLLKGAESSAAFGGGRWYYPWGFVVPDGRVLIVGYGPNMYALDPSGSGSTRRIGKRDSLARKAGSAAMFAPGRILVAGGGGTATASAVVIDATKSTVSTSPTGNMNYPRSDFVATVLPDGRVLATGGSAARKRLIGVAYPAEIWDPASGRWTLGASASKARLYHSSALLLPDATVLTTGGGAAGPVNNLNAEIYYPPYLFKSDGSGGLAARPVLSGAPTEQRYDRAFNIAVAHTRPIARVALVRGGSATHAWDMEQRFVELNFSQAGGTLSVQAPARPELAPPGFYMLFALDDRGVPSVAPIVRLRL